eukprot:365165-Chlamydomonas_euryale.AAC.1
MRPDAAAAKAVRHVTGVSAALPPSPAAAAAVAAAPEPRQAGGDAGGRTRLLCGSGARCGLDAEGAALGLVVWDKRMRVRNAHDGVKRDLDDT